jgi:predicted phosphodiesterase
MKIQLASDLHLELLQRRWPRERLVTPAAGADLLVLAGDIHNGSQAIELFSDWPVPVLYLAGNHEFYHASLPQVRAELRQACSGTQVRLLDDDALEWSGVRFLGSTLWSDYAVDGADPDDAMANAEDMVLDHHRIHADGGFFMPHHALEQHRHSRRWLRGQLEQPFAGRTVVITHFAPHPNSIHPRFEGNPVNGSFVSDLADLVHQADLWMHGHTHDSFDYRVGRCRVVANPRGYANNRRTAATPQELQFENPLFRADYAVELAP